ncbi:MAG TPA: MCE family protein [Amycolatopsis sp.]|uniref:MCE family protein n=1 Tax=Amycolatopsis sp. TaxID=37632 RepID=UPI002B472879|nr:MCE family protein [Amycolatopsis sp.]HKS45930.1 MCE family protein [Amycolatopsis sp.]
MRRLLVALGTVALVSCACSSGFSGADDLPLPGGADLGSHPYRVTAQFADVLDLVPHAAVKVDDVAVGRVDKVSLGSDGWTAEAVLEVTGDVVLPANALANLRQSSLLGEKFVELAAPPNAEGRLGDGAVIPVSRTNRNVEVEEVLGALSLLLNGGGIGQLQTISKELSNVMTGKETDIRAFLSDLDKTVADFDKHRADITSALDGLNRLGMTLSERDDQISGALSNLTPGLDALARQRSALVTMLQSLDQLSTVAVDTVNRSREDLVADLSSLAPIVRRLADAGQNLPQALEILPTFPFTDSALDAIKGDYLNIFVTVKPSPDFQQPLPPLPLPTGGTH